MSVSVSVSVSASVSVSPSVSVSERRRLRRRQHLAPPQLQHHQRPQALAVIDLAAHVLLEQPLGHRARHELRRCQRVEELPRQRRYPSRIVRACPAWPVRESKAPSASG